MAELIQKELQKFDNPEKTEIFFSAHGVPVSYVEQVRSALLASLGPVQSSCCSIWTGSVMRHQRCQLIISMKLCSLDCNTWLSST